MWVAESRVDEYLAAGHELVAEEKPPIATVEDKPKKEAVKNGIRNSGRRKKQND